MTRSAEKTVRYILGALLLLVAINAFGGGYYGLAGAKDIPTEWLKGSPFRNYFIPSLILFVIVGGFSLIASIAVFKQYRFANKLASFTGVIILIWISVQITIMGYVSWMQPTTGIAGLLILLLSWVLPKKKERIVNHRSL